MTEVSFERFMAMLREHLAVNLPDGVEHGDLVDQHGMDSLQRFELLVTVESLAGAEADPPPDLRTCADAFSYYRSLVVEP